MRSFSVLALLSLIAFACTSPSEKTLCAVHDDCGNSEIAQEQGRCAPRVACVEGICDAWCPDTCEVIDPDVNPCTEPGWICPSVDGSTARCIPTEISCETTNDCPDYRPSSTGAWTCDNGTCRFPGFQYLYANP